MTDPTPPSSAVQGNCDYDTKCPKCLSKELVRITPGIPGPTGWGFRCKACQHRWDIDTDFPVAVPSTGDTFLGHCYGTIEHPTPAPSAAESTAGSDEVRR